MNTTRTITLTGRPPVRINQESWPIIAESRDEAYDSEYKFQANRFSNWWIKVRQHDDGRAIIYGGYSYSSNWQNSRSYESKRGLILAGDVHAQAICDAICEVCGDLAAAECAGSDASRWPTLAAECIASMPAEQLT